MYVVLQPENKIDVVLVVLYVTSELQCPRTTECGLIQCRTEDLLTETTAAEPAESADSSALQ